MGGGVPGLLGVLCGLGGVGGARFVLYVYLLQLCCFRAFSVKRGFFPQSLLVVLHAVPAVARERVRARSFSIKFITACVR